MEKAGKEMIGEMNKRKIDEPNHWQYPVRRMSCPRMNEWTGGHKDEWIRKNSN